MSMNETIAKSSLCMRQLILSATYIKVSICRYKICALSIALLDSDTEIRNPWFCGP